MSVGSRDCHFTVCAGSSMGWSDEEAEEALSNCHDCGYKGIHIPHNRAICPS